MPLNTFHINMKDKVSIYDTLVSSGGPKRTKIIMRDHNTGDIIGVYHNKVLVPGSQDTACKQFGIEPAVALPSYNKELGLEHSHPDYPDTQPYNVPITCLWCAGRSGAGSSPNEINVVSTTDRISPALVEGTTNQYVDIVPFKYVSKSADLSYDDRQIYFGRKVFNEGTSSEKIAYFFKAFDTTPQIHVRYLDGTEVTNKMWEIDTSQQVEVYIELKLSVTRQDFRDYFDDVLGWGSADISTISLLTAWYDDTIVENPDADPQDQIRYRYYQNILPFTRFNFSQQQLREESKALDFTYQVYY